jgi:hypothetical protein
MTGNPLIEYMLSGFSSKADNVPKQRDGHGRADEQDSCGGRWQRPADPDRSHSRGAHDNRLAAKLLSRLKSGAMLLADRGLAANYLAFVQLASIRLWLRVNESMP